MARRRRIRRRSRPLKTIKYANHTVSHIVGGAIGANVTKAYNIVAPTSVAGVRKVKNFTINFAFNSAQEPGTGIDIIWLWALIYQPEGMGENPLQVGVHPNTVELYQPEQNVIISGVFNAHFGNFRYKTRLARNLNNGDRIYLLIRPNIALGDVTYGYITVNYAISF